jgi:hypothetical protein
MPLAEIAGCLEVLTIACGRTDRHGRLRVERLIAEQRAVTGFPIVLRALAGDCPNRDARQERERCDPHCPDLWPLSSVDFHAPELT